MLLDNFEQVLDAAPLLADLLVAVPGLKVLVTSRATLHLYAEHEFAVPPLALPPTADGFRETVVGHGSSVVSSTAELTQYESVRLFIARAQAAKGNFTVTTANALAVAEICHRLDGLPLAIELAAARIKLFPPEALLALLGNRLQVLTGGPRDLPARQQTLRNTIDWSYHLLSEGEQAMFRRLAVFVGGCTLEAAEAVYGELNIENGKTKKEPFSDTFSFFEGLAALVDQSLLRQTEGVDGGPRFVMLETIREYALERLAASDELSQTQRRHAEYFLVLAEAAEPALKGHGQKVWLDRLEDELDNLRTAIERWSKTQELEMTARLCTALGLFWDLRDYLSEGVERLEAALAHSDMLPSEIQANVLYIAGRLHLRQENMGSYLRAQEYYQESLALFRALGNKYGLARALADLGWSVIWNGGEIDQAIPLLDESLVLFQTLEDNYGMAWAFHGLGWAAYHQQNYALAQARHEESLALRREAGDQWGIAWSLNNLGWVAFAQQDYAAARAFHEERLAVERALKHKRGISASLLALGDMAASEQDYAAAQKYYEESIAVLQEADVCHGERSSRQAGVTQDHNLLYASGD